MIDDTTLERLGLRGVEYVARILAILELIVAARADLCPMATSWRPALAAGLFWCFAELLGDCRTNLEIEADRAAQSKEPR